MPHFRALRPLDGFGGNLMEMLDRNAGATLRALWPMDGFGGNLMEMLDRNAAPHFRALWPMDGFPFASVIRTPLGLKA